MLLLNGRQFTYYPIRVHNCCCKLHLFHSKYLLPKIKYQLYNYPCILLKIDYHTSVSTSDVGGEPIENARRRRPLVGS